MSLKSHNLICEKAAITSLILTGRLARPLPIIHGIDGYSPRSPHTAGLRDSRAVRPHSRMLPGGECVHFVSDSDYKPLMEGQFIPTLKSWGISAQLI
mgnify:CR=1 FL=1